MGWVATSFDDAGGLMSSRVRWIAATAAFMLAATLAPPPAAAAAAPAAVVLAAGEHALIRFQLPDEATLDRLVAAGADLAARPRLADGNVLADLVVDDRQLAALVRDGAQAVQLIQRESDGPQRAAAVRS